MATTRDEKVQQDQEAMAKARAEAEAEANGSDSSASIEEAKPEAPLDWSDVTAGDDIEVFTHVNGEWAWRPVHVVSIELPEVTLSDPDGFETIFAVDVHKPIRRPEVPIEEEKDGQQRIGGPGTEPRYSTDAGGAPPRDAQLKIKAKAVDWMRDMRRGDELLLLLWAAVEEIDIGKQKVFVAEAYETIEYEHPDMDEAEVIRTLNSLESVPGKIRSAIDHAASTVEQLLAEITSGEAEPGMDIIVELRRRMFEMYSIDDDPHESTHGTPDHDGAPSDGELAATMLRRLYAAEMAARRVESLFTGHAGGWEFDGIPVTVGAADALLTLRHRLADVRQAREDTEAAVAAYRQQNQDNGAGQAPTTD